VIETKHVAELMDQASFKLVQGARGRCGRPSRDGVEFDVGTNDFGVLESRKHVSPSSKVRGVALVRFDDAGWTPASFVQ